MKHFHSGELFGLPARLLDLLAGLALVFLSVSGQVGTKSVGLVVGFGSQSLDRKRHRFC